MSGWDVLQGQLDLAAEGFRRGDDGLTSGALAGAGTTVSHPEIVRSVSLLERAQRLDPRYTNATSRLSVAWMAQGRWDDAANLLEGIMGDLQSTEILDRLALCYVMTRRKQKAAVLWRELARRQPQLAERYLVLADAASSYPPASSPAGNR
jgi:lipopolysaccharide biosynthesis regulator YciM